MQRELSFMDAAINIMLKEKKAFDLYELFDRISLDFGIEEDEKDNLVSKFYTDLTTSAKFVYVGDNKWNLKANEKIELWEKDGSFYKEYTVVELPDEYKEEHFVVKKQKPAPKPVVEEKPAVIVVEEEPIEVVVEKPIVKPVVEPVVEPVAAKPVSTDPAEADEYEEEVFEEYEDFDEEKYNEYMDTYEDQYED